MSDASASMSSAVPGFVGELPPEKFNLSQYCLQKSAKKTPDKLALVVCRNGENFADVSKWTYGAIENAVLCLSAGLASLGLEPGGRIFIRMGNSVDYALTFFAANAAGFVPIPASSQLTETEVLDLVIDSKACAVISDGRLSMPGLPDDVKNIDASEIARLKTFAPGTYAPTQKDDPAFMIYTSGTTSKPKGVLHAQRAVWGRRPMYQDWYGISKSDVLLHTGAFNWTYTLGTGLFDPFANGATSIVFTGEKDITVWPKIIARFNPTIMAGVPTLYRQILKYCALSNRQLSSLRHCLTAGEPLPEAVRQQWKEQTGLELFEALGMSEISTYISSGPSRKIKPGSPGQPQSGRCVAVLPVSEKDLNGQKPVKRGDKGVLAVHRSDPGLMKGYWQRPDEEKAVMRGDWFVTGDLAQMDEDGFIWFEGRQDDLMNTMGYRVSPVEIETLLGKHPLVEQVGVCAISVSTEIEVITAFVVAAESGGNEQGIINELESYCRARLSGYKIPKKWVFIDELPRNAAGKVLRSGLKSTVQTQGNDDNARII